MTVLDPLAWQEAADPANVADYFLDWATKLGDDVITESDWRLEASAIAAGVEIHAEDIQDKKTFLWTKVDVAEQESAAFSGAGMSALCTNTIQTNGGRTFEKSALLPIRQR